MAPSGFQHRREGLTGQAVETTLRPANLSIDTGPVGPLLPAPACQLPRRDGEDDQQGGRQEGHDDERDQRWTRRTVSATTSAAPSATMSPMACSLPVAMGTKVASCCSSWLTIATSCMARLPT